jgi:hypothetical protein
LIESYNNWKRLIYISERTPNSPQIPDFNERQNKVLEHCENHEEVVFEQTVSSFHIYRIVACDLKPLGAVSLSDTNEQPDSVP